MTAHNRWPPAREEHLRKLWDAGLTASECAKELGDGMTRSAVIGKIHRLGLVGRAAAKAEDLKNRTARQTVPRSVARWLQLPPPEPAQAIVAVFDPGPNAVTLEVLKPGMCRFPIGDPMTPEFRFCGEPARRTNVGSSPCPYCARHSAVAYVSTKRQRTVAQQAADKKRRLMAHARKPI